MTVQQKLLEISQARLTQERSELPHIRPRHLVGGEEMIAECRDANREDDAKQVREAREKARHLESPTVHQTEVARRLSDERKKSPNAAPLRDDIQPSRARRQNGSPGYGKLFMVASLHRGAEGLENVILFPRVDSRMLLG